MDDELERARRHFDANRTDTEAAQRYEQALLRAGRHDEIKKLYKLANECKKTWETLTRPPANTLSTLLDAIEPLTIQRDLFNVVKEITDNRRYCQDCQKNVVRVHNLGDFVEAAKKGQCVSIRSDVFDQATDALQNAGILSFARGKGKALPCVVPEMFRMPSPQHLPEGTISYGGTGNIGPDPLRLVMGRP